MTHFRNGFFNHFPLKIITTPPSPSLRQIGRGQKCASAELLGRYSLWVPFLEKLWKNGFLIILGISKFSEFFVNIEGRKSISPPSPWNVPLGGIESFRKETEQVKPGQAKGKIMNISNSAKIYYAIPLITTKETENEQVLGGPFSYIFWYLLPFSRYSCFL